MITAIVALGAEARTLRNRKLEVVVAGPGPERAARAAQAVLARRPSRVVAWGVAGALVPDLAPGTLVRPARVVAESGESYTTTHSNGSQVLVSVAAPVRDQTAREALAARTGAIAVDMESASIAARCAAAGVPFDCVRAISDGVGQRLPEWFDLLMRPDGSLAVGRALLGLCRDPASLAALMSAGRGFRRALASLRQAGQSGL